MAARIPRIPTRLGTVRKLRDELLARSHPLALVQCLNEVRVHTLEYVDGLIPMDLCTELKNCIYRVQPPGGNPFLSTRGPYHLGVNHFGTHVLSWTL